MRDSKASGRMTLPAFFTLAPRRMSLFNAPSASFRILPISAISPGGTPTCAAGVCAANADTPAASCAATAG